MPATITHAITAPDYGEAERIRLQQHTFIRLLWGSAKTQDVVARLIVQAGLSPHIRRLRGALTRHAAADTIKALDHTLFGAIEAQRETIGSTFHAYVRGLFGREVPWLTKELIAHFITQVQALACGGKSLHRSTGLTLLARLEIPVPVGSTMREMRASLRRAAKATLHSLTTRKGRAPIGTDAKDSLARDAALCFLLLVEKQSKRSLAKLYMDHTHPQNLGSYDGRALVQRAIRDTVGRLDLPTATA
jgi:hypothetical protein